jgi:sialate O-acetylesterase
VPVGLIHSAWGGTPIQSWMPPDAFSPEALKAERQFRRESNREATQPNPRPHLNVSFLYNGMIAPLTPYPIRGVVWYQGEANTNQRSLPHYEAWMKGMVGAWRRGWDAGGDVGDFPFYFVQLAPYGKYSPKESLPLMWEIQTRAAKSISNAGMAPTGDIGDAGDIHPKNKHDVGKRLALLALKRTYRVADIVDQGPTYGSHRIEASKVRVRFENIGSGLMSRDGGELAHFEIAGKDGNYVPAKAAIDGDSVVVSSEQVKEPSAVRYAWNATAAPNLANKAGLPAVAFRTDAKAPESR